MWITVQCYFLVFNDGTAVQWCLSLSFILNVFGFLEQSKRVFIVMWVVKHWCLRHFLNKANYSVNLNSTERRCFY